MIEATDENEIVKDPSFDFLVKQLYIVHRKQIYSLKTDVKRLNDELNNLRNEFNRAKISQPVTTPIEKKDAETQVDTHNLKNPRSKLSQIGTIPEVSAVTDHNGLITARPDEVVIDHDPETIPSLTSTCSNGSRKIGMPKEVYIARIHEWLDTSKPEVVLAPETIQCIPETMMPDTETYKVQIIPETIMPELLMQDLLQPPKKLKKTINSITTTNRSPSPSNISKHFNEGKSEILIPDTDLIRRISPRSSRLSRKKVCLPTSPLPKSPRNTLPNSLSILSPNVFSSPEAITIVKKEMQESFDPEETMLQEEFAQKQKRHIKLERTTQPPNNGLVSSQELVKILAQPSPIKKHEKNPVSYDSFDIVEQPKENFDCGPVRKRSERQKLNGYDCQDCAKYFAAMNLSEEEKQKRLKICSRHRSTHPPPPQTPEFFWECGFPSTPECKARGYIKETQKVIEFKHRRKRPLKMLNIDERPKKS